MGAFQATADDIRTTIASAFQALLDSENSRHKHFLANYEACKSLSGKSWDEETRISAEHNVLKEKKRHQTLHGELTEKMELVNRAMKLATLDEALRSLYEHGLVNAINDGLKNLQMKIEARRKVSLNDIDMQAVLDRYEKFRQSGDDYHDVRAWLCIVAVNRWLMGEPFGGEDEQKKKCSSQVPPGNTHAEQYQPNQVEIRTRLLLVLDTYLENQLTLVENAKERLETCIVEAERTKLQQYVRSIEKPLSDAQRIERHDFLLLPEDELKRRITDEPEVLTCLLLGLQLLRRANGQIRNDPEFIEEQRRKVAYNHNSFYLDEDTDHLLNYETMRWLEKVRVKKITPIKEISLENIVRSFKNAIIDFVDRAEIATKEDQHKWATTTKTDDSFSYTYHNPVVQPLKELLQILQWEKRKPFSNSLDIELLILKYHTKEKNLFDAVRFALQSWQYDFFRDRREQKLPEYTVAYKREMLAAIEMEIKYSLCGQIRETAAFRDYIASEQAIDLLGSWELKIEDVTSEIENKSQVSKEVMNRSNPEIFNLLDQIWQDSDEEKKAEMTRFMPGNSKIGNKPKAVKTKNQFMKELENRCREKSRNVPTGDTFRRNYDKWAKDRHHKLIQSNSDK
jgi:hypothetical protein